jgi:hypothetical protein
MTPTKGENLPDQLRRCEATGRMDGLEIEYWTGGGHPPPYFRSDQFRLLTVGGIEMLEFDTLAYAPRFRGEALILEFQLPARPEDVRTVARLLRETGVFTDRYPEEEDPRTSDILRTEVMVTVGGREHKRVYYRRIPEALKPLDAEVERHISWVRTKGKLAVFYKGVRLGSGVERVTQPEETASPCG